MNKEPQLTAHTECLTLLESIDAACHEFETLVSRGESPSVDSFAARFQGDDYRLALQELLWIDWEYRRRAGENPILEIEVERYSTEAHSVRQAWELDLHRRPATACDSEIRGGRYKILHSHAQGGLGQVYVAHDTELDRKVAIKEIRLPFSDECGIRDRFLREVQITSMLEHPGIAPVYGMGKKSDGTPYYAMRLIQGKSLQIIANEFFHAQGLFEPNFSDSTLTLSAYASPEFRELLSHLVYVCQVIAFAHDKGVLHRDIKPSNIMIESSGERTVVDWGLAKFIDEPESKSADARHERIASDDLTSYGAILGTAGFMSPEQSQGNLSEVGKTSDIFSLGGTLYYLLVGASPPRLTESTDQRKMERIFYSELNFKRVPRSLEAICRKALAWRPEQRQQSANELATELESWIASAESGATIECPVTSASRFNSNIVLILTFCATCALASVLAWHFFWSANTVPPMVSIVKAVARENTGVAEVTLALSQASSKTVQFEFSTFAETAKENLDFEPITGTVLFHPGQTTGKIEVKLANDNSYRADRRTFGVKLTDPVGLTLASDSIIVEIVDDDPFILKGPLVCVDTHLTNFQEPSANLGGCPELQVFRGGGVESYRQLIKFDLENFPSDRCAQLELFSLDVAESFDGEPLTVQLFALSHPWTEGDGTDNFKKLGNGASWRFAAPGEEWEEGGTWNRNYDFGYGPTGLIAEGVFTLQSKNSWIRFDVTAAVNAWKKGALPNYGFILISVSGSRTAYAIASSEHEDQSVVPRLVSVEFPDGESAQTRSWKPMPLR